MNDIATNELRTVRSRYLLLLRSENELGLKEAQEEADRIASSLVPADAGLCFPDIDYGNMNRSTWHAAYHYHRLRRALILAGAVKTAEDSAFAERIIGGLRFWLDRAFVNPNWWHNDIGTPWYIGDTALMLWDRLNEEDRAKAAELTARGSMKTRTDIPRWTGANLVWGMLNTMRHALMTEDADLLSACSARTAKELTYSAEGIRDDGAFCQHGPRWYSGGYGASFTCDISKIAASLFGTSFSVPEDNLRILLRHILDGQRNMMLHGYFDANGVGRELTRIDFLKVKEIEWGVRTLSQIEGFPRRDELIQFVSELNHGASEEPDCSYSACTWYPSVSLLTGRRSGTYIGVKCHAQDQYDAEICNSEGELCYNMSYGTRTCLMRRGDEYYNIIPFFDWAHVPGTTARLENDGQLLSHRNWWCLPLPNSDTVGVTKGQYGIVSERPEHDGISLHASFFIFGDCLISLGAGIRDDKQNGLPLTTTLEQSLPVSTVFSDDGSYVSNGGFTYLNLDPETKIEASVIHRKGSWKRNNFEYPDEPIEGDLFLAYIPVNEGHDSYAYAVTPRGKSLPARILSNTPDIHAIGLSDGTVMAVFRKDGTLSVGGKTIEGKAGECVIR